MIKFSVPAFPKFTRNGILTVILLIGISLTAAGIVLAAAPNPGHMWSELSGDGLAQGDIPYGSALNTLSKLAKDANATRYLSNTGATNNPAWAQVNVSNGITGTVGTANLGSGTANSSTYLRGDQTWATPTASVAWGGITGTLSSQTDLNTALGLKEVTANKNASGGYAGLSGVNLQVYNTGGTVLSNLITAATTPRTYTFPDVSGNVLTDATDVTVAQGGTGLSTLTLNNVILGNGASSPTFVAPGTSGNLLQSNGTTWSSVAAGVLIGRQTLTASGTYTPTTGTTDIMVRMVGGGGGGAGGTGISSGCSAGGGGGSGAYAEKYYTAIGASYSYTIGTAGTAGATNGNGGAGASTIFTGPTTLTSPGGSGGIYTVGIAGAKAFLGGAGGAIATGGDVNVGGQPGGNGICPSGTVGVSGQGAPSQFGGGGVSKTGSAAAGVAGVGYGTGGSGGFSLSTTGQAGGAGTAGVIVIWEYR